MIESTPKEDTTTTQPDILDMLQESIVLSSMSKEQIDKKQNKKKKKKKRKRKKKSTKEIDIFESTGNFDASGLKDLERMLGGASNDQVDLLNSLQDVLGASKKPKKKKKKKTKSSNKSSRRGSKGSLHGSLSSSHSNFNLKQSSFFKNQSQPGLANSVNFERSPPEPLQKASPPATDEKPAKNKGFVKSPKSKNKVILDTQLENSQIKESSELERSEIEPDFGSESPSKQIDFSKSGFRSTQEFGAEPYEMSGAKYKQPPVPKTANQNPTGLMKVEVEDEPPESGSTISNSLSGLRKPGLPKSYSKPSVRAEQNLVFVEESEGVEEGGMSDRAEEEAEEVGKIVKQKSRPIIKAMSKPVVMKSSQSSKILKKLEKIEEEELSNYTPKLGNLDSFKVINRAARTAPPNNNNMMSFGGANTPEDISDQEATNNKTTGGLVSSENPPPSLEPKNVDRNQQNTQNVTKSEDFVITNLNHSFGFGLLKQSPQPAPSKAKEVPGHASNPQFSNTFEINYTSGDRLVGSSNQLRNSTGDRTLPFKAFKQPKTSQNQYDFKKGQKRQLVAPAFAGFAYEETKPSNPGRPSLEASKNDFDGRRGYHKMYSDDRFNIGGRRQSNPQRGLNHQKRGIKSTRRGLNPKEDPQNLGSLRNSMGSDVYHRQYEDLSGSNFEAWQKNHRTRKGY